MTPAITALKRAKMAFEILEYQHDPNAPSYGEEAADALGLEPSQVFKTLLVALVGHKSALAVAIVPVTHQLNLKLIARALGAKKAAMADAAIAEKTTGYVVGGISPVGQKKALPTVIDASAESLERMHVSAGRRGLEIALAPQNLARMTRATFFTIRD